VKVGLGCPAARAVSSAMTSSGADNVAFWFGSCAQPKNLPTSSRKTCEAGCQSFHHRFVEKAFSCR